MANAQGEGAANHSAHRSARRVVIVGAGIAGLAAAVLLIRDAGFAGRDIRILEAGDVAGGALDGSGDAANGYVIRGGRMLEAHYASLWDLLASVPSLDTPGVSVAEECRAFNAAVVSDARARLVRAGRPVDTDTFGLSRRDIADLFRLAATPEARLGARTIEESFAPSFFATPFWALWATTFAFQRWSSAAEMRRYMLRFMHLLPGFGHLHGIQRTLLNQYDAIVQPVEAWLRARGVVIEFGARVTDVQFDDAAAGLTPRAVLVQFGAGPTPSERPIDLGEGDLLLLTLGSMVAGSGLGGMHAPALAAPERDDGAWSLWRRLAARDARFGRPEVFAGDVPRTSWLSFTVTLREPAFFDSMRAFTGNAPGTGGLVTLWDSAWSMSVVLAHQPHFRGQPAGVQVCWGDGLLPARPGDFVGKPMTACTGEEILVELYSHLGCIDALRPTLASTTCIPCAMPWIDSQFMPRVPGDRPDVLPAGTRRLGLLGQFVEAPDDCVFTVEYSVRTAQMAVYGLTGAPRAVTPVYAGPHSPRVQWRAARALLRGAPASER